MPSAIKLSHNLLKIREFLKIRIDQVIPDKLII